MHCRLSKSELETETSCFFLEVTNVSFSLVQGHCKALLLSIERLLGVLRVQRLALPAAEGAEGIWLNKFGFRRMLEDQVRNKAPTFSV